ncbi:MAG: cupredoxin domain-containing protein [Chloroflexota bacterium]|nr:cupredoxin domain-containing protein [Chloroflexota bacterium]
MRKLKLMSMFAVAAALVIGSTACAAPGGTVNATLTEMKITLDRNSVPAGPVTFVVKNNGTVEHELVVIQTDLPQDKLAPDVEEAGKMDETGNVGETGEVKPGESKTFTITIPAGHYVLMCNEVGHYAGGMHLAFTVN